MTFDNFEYESVANYSCDTGFNLNGQEQVTCQATGDWTGIAPTCERIGKIYNNDFSVMQIQYDIIVMFYLYLLYLELRLKTNDGFSFLVQNNVLKVC